MGSGSLLYKGQNYKKAMLLRCLLNWEVLYEYKEVFLTLATV
jgi:hypothetical protein